MEIKIKFFALLKEVLGREEMAISLPAGISCDEVLSFLKGTFTHAGPALDNSLVAINGEYASKSTVLKRFDEMAILPPASGG